MKSPLPRYLEHVLADCKEDSGETAQYIPELAAANPDHFGVALCTIDGDMYAAGDADIEFAIESISKAFAYAIALTDRGFDGVAKKVGVEPSGDAFNKLSVNSKTGLPDNPLINAGAITTHTLVNGKTPRERYDRVAEIMSKCAGRKLRVMEDVYSSEMKTADRNRALAYMLHMTGIIEDDPMAAVEYYTRQCSLAVTAKDLAAMVATLANRGIQPVTKEVIFTPEVCVRVQSVMLTCGMYDYAGDWVTAVGIPSKSGVGGGIIGTVPGQGKFMRFTDETDTDVHSRHRHLLSKARGARQLVPWHQGV
jgi:glutaminase